MAILKKQLPEKGKITIEIYEWKDPSIGWGHGDTLGFVDVDVDELEDHTMLKNMVNVPQHYLEQYDEGMGVGYDIVTEEEFNEIRKGIDARIERIEELKRNLLKLK